MTTCQTCPAGKEPNGDKTECGKQVFFVNGKYVEIDLQSKWIDDSNVMIFTVQNTSDPLCGRHLSCYRLHYDQ